MLAEAKRQGLADINWDVIPFDWINDSNIAATRYMLMTQIKPGSVVLFHDTYSSTVDLVYQFIPVLKANGYHLVTVSQLLGPREPGSSYGARDNGPPVNDLHDIAVEEIPALPNTPSPAPMPNFPITDIPGANSGGPNNGDLKDLRLYLMLFAQALIDDLGHRQHVEPLVQLLLGQLVADEPAVDDGLPNGLASP